MRTSKDDGASAPLNEAEEALRAALVDELVLPPERVAAFDAETPLFGALPELDSMAVATLLTDLEDRLGIVIDDDDMDAEMFETFGNLSAFLTRKLDQRTR